MISNKIIIAALLMVVFSLGSCAKLETLKDAENGLVGHWLVCCQPFGESKSGEMFLDDEGNGSIMVFNEENDTITTIFESQIKNMDINYPGAEGWEDDFYRYWGSFSDDNGDVVQITFWANPGSEKLTETTPTIIFSIDYKHDGEVGTTLLEEYYIELTFERN